MNRLYVTEHKIVTIIVNHMYELSLSCKQIRNNAWIILAKNTREPAYSRHGIRLMIQWRKGSASWLS